MKNLMTIFWFTRFHSAKQFRIRFDNVKVFIRVYSGASYSILYGPEKYDAIYHKKKYLIGQKNQNCAKIKICLYDSLSLEKISTLLNIMNSLSQFLIKAKITTTVIYH